MKSKVVVITLILSFIYTYAKTNTRLGISKEDSIYCVKRIAKNLIISRVIHFERNYGSYLFKNGYYDLMVEDDHIFSLLEENNCLPYINLKRTELQYPRKSYLIFEFMNPYFYRTCCNDKVLFNEIRPADSDPLKEYKYYIAFDPLTKDIIYLSGDFIQSVINQDFNLNIDSIASFNNFLEMKLLKLEIKNIRFYKKKGTTLYFKGNTIFFEEGKRDVIFYISYHKKRMEDYKIDSGSFLKGRKKNYYKDILLLETIKFKFPFWFRNYEF